MIFAASHVSPRLEPFPHALTQRLYAANFAERVLQWFDTDAPWQLRIESFYEQYELNLHQDKLPSHLQGLISVEAIDYIVSRMLTPLTAESLSFVEANAHKLLPGQTIKIHNDYIGGEETHRVLIQFNREWSDQNGGLLMLFSSPQAHDIARVIRPLHGSAMAFEISPSSFHAVSTILAGARYTLVYSFKRAN